MQVAGLQCLGIPLRTKNSALEAPLCRAKGFVVCKFRAEGFRVLGSFSRQGFGVNYEVMPGRLEIDTRGDVLHVPMSDRPKI